MTLKVVFMGTPDFSAPVLAEIIGQGHEVVAVYSRAPKPAAPAVLLYLTTTAKAAAAPAQ